MDSKSNKVTIVVVSSILVVVSSILGAGILVSATTGIFDPGLKFPFGSDAPGSVVSIDVAATEYARHVGDGDVQWLMERTRLSAEAEVGGETLDSVIEKVTACIQWPDARLVATSTPVSPMHGTAVFTDGSTDVTFQLGYTESSLDHVKAHSWYVVHFSPPC